MIPMNVKLSKLTLDAKGLWAEGEPEEDGRVFRFFVPSAIIMSAGMSLVATYDHTYQLTVGGNSYNLVVMSRPIETNPATTHPREDHS